MLGEARVVANPITRPVAPETHPDPIVRATSVRANASLPRDGSEPMSAPLVLRSYTVATLPPAALWTGGLAYVPDDTGGPTVAFSDGAVWRRLQDTAVVS